MNVKENVFSSEREFKKALRDTFKFKFKFSLFASSARGTNSYQQWQIEVNLTFLCLGISIIT